MGRIGENMGYMDGADYQKLRPVQSETYKKLVGEITK